MIRVVVAEDAYLVREGIQRLLETEQTSISWRHARTCRHCSKQSRRSGPTVIVGGTGTFAGATGTLGGTVKLAGSNARPAGESIVKLSGTIHFGP